LIWRNWADPGHLQKKSSVFIYIGFWWDLSAKGVELPEKVKYLDRISTWTHGSLHTAKETEKTIGTLRPCLFGIISQIVARL
jgi:hypothetical protein